MKEKVIYMGAVALRTLYNKKIVGASKIGLLQAAFILAPDARNYDTLRAEMEEYQGVQAEIDDLQAHERETMFQYGVVNSR